MSARRRGFTILELLVVVLVIGILAGLAIAKFGNTKDKAKLSSIKSDLKNLIVAQEAHFSNWNTYGTKAQLVSRVKYDPSPGNTWAINATTSGFTATVTNASITKSPTKCQVTVGRNTSPVTEGQYICS